MAGPEATQPLDLAAIDLPSDRITMGTIRRVHPNLFADYKNSLKAPSSNLNVPAIIAEEIDLARIAYARALGVQTRERSSAAERHESILNLDVDYRTYGISTGIRHTLEMVRDLERQAAQQAKQTGR
jgi:hypothetical protein